jgi:membrane-associated phospholipid phosphatase
MCSLLFQNRWFLVPFLLVWLAAGFCQFYYTQNYISISFNQAWTPSLDLIFKYGTHLGDGRFIAFSSFILLLFSYRKALLVLFSYCASGTVTLLFKCLIFPLAPRPSQVFSKSLPWLHSIPDISLLSFSSFPSGHTASAFALFSLLALFSHNSLLRFLCLFPAVCVALARVYLLQHFLIDVFVGASLGVLSSFMLSFYLQKYWEAKPKSWHQRGLLFAY